MLITRKSTTILLATLLLLLSVSLTSFPAYAETDQPAPGFVQTVAVAHSLPPSFTASPFASEYLVTGAEAGPGSEFYFPSNGDGTFGAKTTIPGLGSVDGPDVADIDNDGDNDLLICDGNTGETFLYTNGGGGSFIPSLVATGSVPQGFCANLRIADFNGDGNRDFVVGDVRAAFGATPIQVHLQGPIGTFTPSTVPDISWAAGLIFGIATGDFNGNSKADILMQGYTGTSSGEVHLYTGDGAMTPSFTRTQVADVNADFPIVGNPTSLAAFDLEGDGDLDFVAGGSADGTHYVYTNSGTGFFTKPTGAAFDVNNFAGADAFDFDADGDDDVVVVNWAGFTVFFVGNTGGVLAAPLAIGSVARFPSVGIGAPELARVIEVDIDIKPGSDPNSINCNNENGAVAVAVLTTDDFDATTVDHTTVEFGPDGATEIHSNKQGVKRHEADVDGDGDADLVLHFRLGDTGLTCDSTEATLTGSTFGGQAIEGTGPVRMVPPGS